jgi:hypothetical protein
VGDGSSQSSTMVSGQNFKSRNWRNPKNEVGTFSNFRLANNDILPSARERERMTLTLT